jgi:Domain of unknown function (DUF3854)/AAA domain
MPVLEDLTIPLGIVEGEKKALKACQEGLMCVAIGGLWSWLEGGRLLPKFDDIALQDRQILLYPDSDVWQRQDLLQAVYRLGAALEAKGAHVRVVRIPPGPGKTKQGLDDYLVAYSAGEAQALRRVALTDPCFAAARAKAEGHRTLHGDGQAAVQPVVATMSDIISEPIDWLWWPYVALKKTCMLDGDPGIGKSLLMTQLAASLSRGYPLPDQQGQPTLRLDGPQTTLLLSTEDGLADTIKPRWETANADCTKIHVLTGWLGPEDEVHAFTLITHPGAPVTGDPHSLGLTHDPPEAHHAWWSPCSCLWLRLRFGAHGRTL